VHGEGIAFDHVHPRLGGVLRPEHCRQCAIDLDHDHASRARDEAVGQPATPGSDLDDGLIARQLERIDDPVEDAGVGEEVLTQPLERGRKSGRGAAISRRHRRALSREG
jgi:hypothetical protein